MRSRVLVALWAMACAVVAWGQMNPPHAAYVYPGGGQQGTTFEVTVAGQFLNGAREVYVSGSGVKAEVVEVREPLRAAEFTKARDQAKELREKAKQGGLDSLSDEEKKTAATLIEEIAGTLRARMNPAIANVVRLRVTIAPGAELGHRELRIAAKNGLTNPLVFCVDQLPEVSRDAVALAKVEPKELRAAARRMQEQKRVAASPIVDVTLPVIVNGEIMPGGIDRYHFQAKKGQRLVFAAKTRELIPYISDAVPGWFQAVLSLTDGKGNEVASADHYRFQQDPVLFYEVPEDGEYTLQVRDSIYRGREDFIYRVAMGQLPFVTSVFPLGGKTGGSARLELSGWNLPVTSSKQPAKDEGIHSVAIREGEWTSNPVLFATDDLPEVTEKASHDSVNHAESLKLPVVVNGKIDKSDEWDVYKFEGHAGEQMVAEVFARRLNSPLDSVLKLTDANGKQLAFNDDYDDKSAALITHQADSRIAFKLPAKGTYYLWLGDTQHNGGPEYAYRLRVSDARPDFELRVVPASVSVRPGLTVPVTVYALRHDGFAGEIQVRLKDAPRGFVLSGGRIPAGVDSVRVTIGAPAGNIDSPQKLSFEGEAVIGGKKVHRTGVPAEDMMQAFAWHHLVPAKEAFVVVTGQGRRRGEPFKFAQDKPVRLAPGSTVEVRMGVPGGPLADQMLDRIELELNQAPEGIEIKNVIREHGTLGFVLRADPEKIKPGMKGNLIVDVFLKRPPNEDGKARQVNRIPAGVLPAIQFEVVGKS